MNGKQDLISGNWEALGNMALGESAEMLAKTLFLKEGFHVYSNLVDDNGIDMIVSNKTYKNFHIQVKSITSKTDYVYMREKYFKKEVPNLYCMLISFKENSPEVFLFPFSTWDVPDAIFKYRPNYKEPEFGINASRKNLSELSKYKFEIAINDLR